MAGGIGGGEGGGGAGGGGLGKFGEDGGDGGMDLQMQLYDELHVYAPLHDRSGYTWSEEENMQPGGLP